MLQKHIVWPGISACRSIAISPRNYIGPLVPVGKYMAAFSNHGRSGVQLLDNSPYRINNRVLSQCMQEMHSWKLHISYLL